MVHVPAQSFPASRRRALRPAALGIVLLVVGAWLRWGRDEAELGWTCLGSGAVLLLWFGSPLWRRSPIVWFDDDGLRARLPGFGCVPWADIADVRLLAFRTQALLVVDRTAAARDAAPRSPLLRAFAQMAGADDLVVPVDGLSATPAQVLAVVQLAWRHATGRA